MAAIHEVSGATFERVARTLQGAFHALKSYEYGNHSAVLANQVTGEIATAHFMLTGVAIPSAPPERKPFAWARDDDMGVDAHGQPLRQITFWPGSDDGPPAHAHGWFPLYRDPA